jgi:hypothetical protein
VALPPSAPDLVAEQDEFERSNAAWLRRQEEAIAESARRDSERLGTLIATVEAGGAPAGLSLREMRPGDVVVVTAGDDLLGAVIPPADWLHRTVEHLRRGELLDAARTREMAYSHTVTCVKSVGGALLFLDHTSVGSRVIDERGFLEHYGARGGVVARPLAPVDGARLWEAAKAAARKEKSDYHLVGEGKSVCSERSAFAVTEATGLPVDAEGWVVDVSPADFLDPTTRGKYFEVRGLREGWQREEGP